MNRTGLIAVSTFAALIPLIALGADQHAIVQNDAVQWKPAPPAFPDGAEIAVLYGDPSKEGPFAVRMKLPAGYKIPPHIHPSDENETILSGTMHVGMGDLFNETRTDAVKPGGVLLMPKGMHHYAWFPEETVIQGNGVGPSGITYINEKDDPRKSN